MDGCTNGRHNFPFPFLLHTQVVKNYGFGMHGMPSCILQMRSHSFPRKILSYAFAFKRGVFAMFIVQALAAHTVVYCNLAPVMLTLTAFRYKCKYETV